MVYFLKNVYDKIPNNVSKEQLVEIFIKYINLVMQDYPNPKRFFDLVLIKSWMQTDKQLENKFASVRKNKPLKTKKEMIEFDNLVRESVKHLFPNNERNPFQPKL